MPMFKDDHIIVIVPGSRNTLAQQGLPESFTPARLKIRTCMFPAQKAGEWEPFHIRPIEEARIRVPTAARNGVNGDKAQLNEEEIITFEEDLLSEDGAIWPIRDGKIVHWPCLFGLLSYVYNTLNPPFHTPILLISQATWMPNDYERLAQFFFERFKMPALAIMDSAMATCYAYGLGTATVIDVGFHKTDISAISDFNVHRTGRTIGLEGCGGEAMTRRLMSLLSHKNLSWEICEQLKKSAICEILAPGVPFPTAANGHGDAGTSNEVIISQGRRLSSSAVGDTSPTADPDTDVIDERNGDAEEGDGVLDVASIVTGGKMSEYLAKKEREKSEKAAQKKKTGDTASTLAKVMKLPNSKRERNTFIYEDHGLRDALLKAKYYGYDTSELVSAYKDDILKPPKPADPNDASGKSAAANPEDDENSFANSSRKIRGASRKEYEIGLERFQAAPPGMIDQLADAIHRTISSVEEVKKRSELWDSLVLVGNGCRVRGFREALAAVINARYLISPSSATIFTSELPSNLSTPLATGANTPQPSTQPFSHNPTGVNPLLIAATTAQNPLLQHQGSSNNVSAGNALLTVPNAHSSHGQTPSSFKFAKLPEYFPEWKDISHEDCVFLGAQVAAKVLFLVDQGASRAFMTRPDFNENGPSGIHDFLL